MNSKNVGRLVSRTFPRVPPRAEIPETVSPFGGLVVDWQVGDIRVRTRKHTMGRVFATATSAKFPGEYVSVYASNRLAAVRRLVKYCHTFYPPEERSGPALPDVADLHGGGVGKNIGKE